MNIDKLNQIIEEEVKLQRKRLFLEQGNPNEPVSDEPSTEQPAPPSNGGNAAPALNKKKSVGIIVGALKTLFNSEAIQGVDRSAIKNFASELISDLELKVKAYSKPEEPVSDELDDEAAYDEENQELNDQSQYEDDFSKKISDKEEESPDEEPPAEEEPLFEAKHFKNILNIND